MICFLSKTSLYGVVYPILYLLIAFNSKSNEKQASNNLEV